jgi:hypothetical protein
MVVAADWWRVRRERGRFCAADKWGSNQGNNDEAESIHVAVLVRRRRCQAAQPPHLGRSCACLLPSWLVDSRQLL